MVENKMFKMKRNIVKKILAVALIASMSFGCTTSAYASSKSANVKVKGEVQYTSPLFYML